MVDIGVYEVTYDEGSKEFVLVEQLAGSRERRFHTIAEVTQAIQADISATMNDTD